MLIKSVPFFMAWIVASMLLFCCSGQESSQIYGSGTIEATEIMVSSQSMGRVLSIPLQEGDRVQAGQVVARIDSEKLQLQKQQLLASGQELRFNLDNAERAVELAEEKLQNAKKRFNRIKNLLADNSTTQQQYDDVETAYKAAGIQHESARSSYRALRAKALQIDAQLELIDSRLRDTRITAPITGTILNKYVQTGELVRQASPVVEIADLQYLIIRVYVSEPDLGRIGIGDAVDIAIDAFPQKRFSGTVAWISPQAEFTPKNVQTREARADLVYAVKVRMENPDGIFKIGMPADVYF